MKTSLDERKPRDEKRFRDFAMFSVYVVRPGAVFTPRESDKRRRPRVMPLRRPTRRTCRSAWDRTQTIYISSSTSKIATTQIKEDEDKIEAREMEQWAKRARHARLSWMDENPY